MPKRTSTVNYEICDPTKCPDGKCYSVKACEHKVLVQDAPGEAPYLIKMCQSCGACVTACPLKAIKLM